MSGPDLSNHRDVEVMARVRGSYDYILSTVFGILTLSLLLFSCYSSEALGLLFWDAHCHACRGVHKERKKVALIGGLKVKQLRAHQIDTVGRFDRIDGVDRNDKSERFHNYEETE